jgi:prepilin-type N-terminal cleavage/methylation domain-containing protein
VPLGHQEAEVDSDGDIRAIPPLARTTERELIGNSDSGSMAALPIADGGPSPGGPRRLPRVSPGPERGFSLVELLAATAILGTVLVSICALYVMAQKQVKAARLTTVAATIGEDVLEDLRGMQRGAIRLLLDTPSTQQAGSWSSLEADPAYATLPEANALAFQAVLDAWRERVEEELPQGNVVLVAEAFRDRPTSGSAGTSTFSEARFLRLEVSVAWSDAGRIRRVTYNQFKF